MYAYIVGAEGDSAENRAQNRALSRAQSRLFLTYRNLAVSNRSSRMKQR